MDILKSYGFAKVLPDPGLSKWNLQIQGKDTDYFLDLIFLPLWSFKPLFNLFLKIKTRKY